MRSLNKWLIDFKAVKKAIDSRCANQKELEKQIRSLHVDYLRLKKDFDSAFDENGIPKN